jgi:restriction system protein
LIQPIFQPKFNFIENLFSGLKSRKEKKLKKYFNISYDKWVEEAKRIEEEWEVLKIKIEAENIAAENTYNKRIESVDRQKQNLVLKYNKLISEWDSEKSLFKSEINVFNSEVESRKRNYLNKNKIEVEFHNYQILKSIEFLEPFPNDFELHYNAVNEILIIEYVLPALEDIPTLKEVRFLSTKNEIKEIHLSETQKKAFYDKTIYNIILGIIHLIFKSDSAKAIDAISINGWVDSIDKRTGRRINNCIVSLQTNKLEFLKIDLKNVDPKLCFKNLKGIGSSELSSLVAIQPILTINKKDKRFIESKNIDFEETTNLALMDWGDFEHLIRELFEKEFSINGGEVKVTQASRDGGVDAIAFDPDPIRGGKIIIQAKRYTNVVGVSAVRDLYGTVMNEGATKGILVTTSDYGSDSYMFAKDKPLTLLNGSNLLHLLLKHGQKAKIDIKEAKKIIKEQEKNSRHFG